MSEADKDLIETLNITSIKILLTKGYNHLLSHKELIKIDKEAKLIYKLIKEDKEYIEENGITYHLNKDTKDFFKKRLYI